LWVREIFYLQKIIKRHHQAFLELERQGKQATETKKVNDFLARINAFELQAAKQQVAVNKAMLNNSFEYIKLYVP
jgi:hypothetical protein